VLGSLLACWACWRANESVLGVLGGRAGGPVLGVLGVLESPQRDLGKSCRLLPSKSGARSLHSRTSRYFTTLPPPDLSKSLSGDSSRPNQHAQHAHQHARHAQHALQACWRYWQARLDVLSTPIEHAQHAQHASTEPSTPSTPVPKLAHEPLQSPTAHALEPPSRHTGTSPRGPVPVPPDSLAHAPRGHSGWA
jgi:hypothetical protein